MALSSEFFTIDELAGLLKINRRTVQRMMKRGDLPAYQIGRQKRIRRDDVEAFLRRCRLSGMGQKVQS